MGRGGTDAELGRLVRTLFLLAVAREAGLGWDGLEAVLEGARTDSMAPPNSVNPLSNDVHSGVQSVVCLGACTTGVVMS